VTDGLVGKPKRVFRLNQAETLEYMRHVHETRRSANPKVWLEFVRWYKDWRDRVSTVPAVVSRGPDGTAGDDRDRSGQGIRLHAA
jgi:hypothetical protein